MNEIRPEINARQALPRLLGAGLLACVLAIPALAQGVYRIVGPDGRISFSDKPPPAASASGHCPNLSYCWRRYLAPPMIFCAGS